MLWFKRKPKEETLADVTQQAQIAIIKSIPDTQDAEEMLSKAKAVQSLGEVSKGEKRQKLDPNVMWPVGISTAVTVGLYVAGVVIQKDMLLDLKPLDKARAFGDGVLRVMHLKR